MFEIGDYVICRSGGVWRVNGSDSKNTRFIKHATGEFLNVPTDSGDFVRRISSLQTIHNLISQIENIGPVRASGTASRQALLDDAMSKFDEYEVPSIDDLALYGKQANLQVNLNAMENKNETKTL